MSNTPRPEHEPDPEPDFSTFLPPEDSGEYIVPGASEKPVEELGSEDDIVEPESRKGPASARQEFDWEDVTIEPGTRAETSSGLEEDTIEPGTRRGTSSAEPETDSGEDVPEPETDGEEEVPPITTPITTPKPPAAKWPWIGMAATLLVGVGVGGVGSGLFSPQPTKVAEEQTSPQPIKVAEEKTTPEPTKVAEEKTTAPVTPKVDDPGKTPGPPTPSAVLTHLDAIDQALSDPGTYKQGLELARKGVDLAQATGDPATQLEAYLLLSQAQEANGDFDAALKTIAEASKIQGPDEKSGTAKTLRGRLKSAERRILRSKKSSRTGAGTGGTATAPGARPRGMENGFQRKLSIGLGVRILVALQANQPARLVELQSNLKDVQQEVERERVPDSLLNLAVANREIGAYFQDQSDEQAIKYLEDAAQNCVDGLRRFPGIERDEFIRNELRKELGTVVSLLRTASDTLARRLHELETKNGKLTGDNATLSMQLTEARASLKRAEDRIAAMSQPVPPVTNPVAAGPDPKKLLAQIHELEVKLNSTQVEARQAKDAVVAANRRAERLGQGEKQWAVFAQGLAGLAGFPTAMPDENNRWKQAPPETDAETLGWMEGLQAAIRTKVEQTDRLSYGEQSWAKFARRVAQKVGYGAPLPEVRWARTPDRASEDWEDRLAIFVPSVPPVPTTPAAERDFNKGYEDYFHCEYAQAIARFDAAIAKVPSDARFYYFRGLARLGDHQSGGTSKREDGIEDLRQGIILERRGTPSPQQVSQVLVRIQGELRQWVEAFRATGELPPGALPPSPPCLPRIPSATMTLAPGRFEGIPTIAPGCVPCGKAL